MFLILYLFPDDFRQTKYLKIYGTDLRQIFRVYRTMAVGWMIDQKLAFDFLRDVAWQTSFFHFSAWV